jgi:hypothetical protein
MVNDRRFFALIAGACRMGSQPEVFPDAGPNGRKLLTLFLVCRIWLDRGQSLRYAKLAVTVSQPGAYCTKFVQLTSSTIQH